MSDIRTFVDGIFDELVAIRRDIHAHPETGMHETRTAALIRSELEKTRGLYILEDETNRMKRKHKGADSWGAILSDDGQTYVGPNLLGRLLMELRDNGGALEYNIPEDMTDFKDLI